MTVAIQKWGNSQGIRISRELLAALKWRVDEQISLTVENNKLIIEPVSPPEKISLKDVFDGYSGNYEPFEVNWGERVGNEVW